MGVLMVGVSVDGKAASTDATTADAMADMRALLQAVSLVEQTDSTMVAAKARLVVVEKGEWTEDSMDDETAETMAEKTVSMSEVLLVAA